MMKNRSLPKPTDAELAILRVLWNRGPSTVREVFDSADRAEPTVYTTVLKQLQIMHEKGLVRREEASRSHVYSAVAPEAETQQQLVRHLLDKAFEGSAEKLVVQALSAAKAGSAELAAIRKLIQAMERK